MIKQSVLTYLRFFAKKSLKRHQPTTIGIAGSVGKSSTRNAIEAILKDHFPTKTIGNSETGIPLGILGMKPENYSKLDWLTMLVRSPLNMDHLKGTKYLIAEMGIDDPFPPKNMDYLLTILKPDIAISLNASATHTMQFEKALTQEERTKTGEEKVVLLTQKIAEEDAKIITKSDCKIGIYNADDENITQIIEKGCHAELDSASHEIPKQVRDDKKKLLTFGSQSSNDISYGQYTVSLSGTSFKFYIRNEDKSEELTLSFPDYILPREYREVFAAAILATLPSGLSLKQIKSSLENNYILPKGRSTLLKGIRGSVIIDSTYNASKAATAAFLDLVDTLKKETGRPIVFLFGDMRELGEEAQVEHKEIAEKIIDTVDHLYLVGPLTRQLVLPVVQQKESLFKEIRWFDTSTRAGEYMKDNLPKDAIVLAKGSQNTIFLELAVYEILADKKDSKLLCRQELFWEKGKKTTTTIS